MSYSSLIFLIFFVIIYIENKKGMIYMKMKINVDTAAAAKRISALAQGLPTAAITITDNQGLRVSAKSMLGMLYALEFNELWLESDIDCWSLFKEFEAE